MYKPGFGKHTSLYTVVTSIMEDRVFTWGKVSCAGHTGFK